jgi:hypothetical protein
MENAPANEQDQKVTKEFFTLFGECNQSLRANVDPVSEAQVCVKAADRTNAFAPNERPIERRAANVAAANALLRNKQPYPALTYANKAVDLVKLFHEDGAGASSAYSILAQVEASLTHLQLADQDLTRAENFERDAIQKESASNPGLVQKEYIPTLQNLLRFHGQVLAATGDGGAARMKLAEAAKL